MVRPRRSAGAGLATWPSVGSVVNWANRGWSLVASELIMGGGFGSRASGGVQILVPAV